MITVHVNSVQHRMYILRFTKLIACLHLSARCQIVIKVTLCDIKPEHRELLSMLRLLPKVLFQNVLTLISLSVCSQRFNYGFFGQLRCNSEKKSSEYIIVYNFEIKIMCQMCPHLRNAGKSFT